MCRVNRTKSKGFCGCLDTAKVARAALHFWEEPCLTGKRGSGTVFFSGCTLRCCYCQNYKISAGNFGKEVSAERLAEIFLELQEKGAHNINLVTATQYLPQVMTALTQVKNSLKIPVVYNTSGYERIETIRALEGFVDIYLPDFKYFSNEIAYKYSKAKDYFKAASSAVKEMARQAKMPVFDAEGIMQKGLIVRHLVLPGHWRDSMEILNWLAENLPKGCFLLSMMSQYMPCYKSARHQDINRRVTTYEYEKVVEEALKLGLTDGYIQQRSAAREEYTPPFDLNGV